MHNQTGYITIKVRGVINALDYIISVDIFSEGVMTCMITMIWMNSLMNGAKNSETVVMRTDMTMRMIIGKKRWIRKYREE